MDGSQPVNPFLSGNFAPVREEVDIAMTVEGEMPADLAGAFYRNGANPQFDQDPDYHWFSGDGMIHGFFVGDGQVRYRNRYVQTPRWRAEHAAGRKLFGTFGNPATSDPSVAGVDSGVANTNIVWHGGKLLALEEGHRPFAMDPRTLESVGYIEAYRGRVTAHPKIDPETGEMVWFAYAIDPMPFGTTCSYGVTDAAGNVVLREDFQAPYSAMMHDFMVTRRHALFPVLPLTGSLERAMRGQSPYAWEPDRSGFVGVLDRKAGVSSLRWFEIDACYVFHPMNAWEEGETIFADVMEYDTAPLFPRADGAAPSASPSRLVRWTIDLAAPTNRIKRQPLDDLAGEFPRLDERRTGLAYRHGYFPGNSGRPGSVVFDTLAHIDLASGRRADYAFPKGDTPGEFVFVPRSAEAAEGDGWLVGVVYRGSANRSDFVVFDAADLPAGPVASAHMPCRVPFGFHGNWRPA